MTSYMELIKHCIDKTVGDNLPLYTKAPYVVGEYFVRSGYVTSVVFNDVGQAVTVTNNETGMEGVDYGKEHVTVYVDGDDNLDVKVIESGRTVKDMTPAKFGHVLMSLVNDDITRMVMFHFDSKDMYEKVRGDVRQYVIHGFDID